MESPILFNSFFFQNPNPKSQLKKDLKKKAKKNKDGTWTIEYEGKVYTTPDKDLDFTISYIADGKGFN